MQYYGGCLNYNNYGKTNQKHQEANCNSFVITKHVYKIIIIIVDPIIQIVFGRCFFVMSLTN